jgi:hypothetical protein
VLGSLAGWFIEGDAAGTGLLLLAGGMGLTIAAYLMAARSGGEAVDGTTEMAALVILGLSVVASLGFPLVTSAIASVMVLALIEKTRIHDTIQRVGCRGDFRRLAGVGLVALGIASGVGFLLAW